MGQFEINLTVYQKLEMAVVKKEKMFLKFDHCELVFYMIVFGV